MKETLRHEIKFCCLERELGRIYEWLCCSPAHINKQFPDRRVNNIYFDSFQLQDASDNLVGLASREKLRLRWYGESGNADRMSLERKIKRGLLGYKKILAIDPILLDGLSRNQLHRHLSQAGETDNRFDIRLRNPTLRNSYRREYYADQSGRVRVTVDREQLFHPVDRADDVLSGNRIEYPVVVIEVKFDEDDAPLARQAIRGFPLRPTRHSKYLAGLSRLVEHPYF